MLGVDDPDVDVEVIALAHGFYRDLGLKRVTLLLNSMGDAALAPRATSAALSEYLLDHAGAFGDDFRERVEQNPLRVLDSKREDWQDVIERAPQLTEYLSDDAEAHFERVQRGLDDLGIAYELAPRLVRGLRLLHEHHVRVRQRRARRRAERGRRRRALRPARRGDGRAADTRASASASGSSGCSSRATPRACSAGDDRDRLDAFVVDGVGDGSAVRCSSRSCASRACAPTARTVAAR